MLKRKKAIEKALCLVLAFAVTCGFTFTVFAGAADAASKTTVYVVKSIKIKQGSKTTTTKITYNSNGLFKKIYDPREKETQTFTYGKNGKIKKFTDKIAAGDWKGWTETRNYTWENGKMKKIKGTRGSDEYTYTLKYKSGKLSGMHSVEKWKEDGKTQTGTTDYTYTLKYGHIYKSKTTSMGHTITTTQTMDKKGNVTKVGMKSGTETIGGYYNATITYKNGRISKMKTERYNPMMKEPEKNTKTVTYKKITVSKSYAEKIKAQQWKLLNGSASDDFAW